MGLVGQKTGRRTRLGLPGAGVVASARRERLPELIPPGRARRRCGPARSPLSRQARQIGADLRPVRRARDLDGGTALGPQQRWPADRVGGKRIRRLVSGGVTGGDPGAHGGRTPSRPGVSGTGPGPKRTGCSARPWDLPGAPPANYVPIKAGCVRRSIRMWRVRTGQARFYDAGGHVGPAVLGLLVATRGTMTARNRLQGVCSAHSRAALWSQGLAGTREARPHKPAASAQRTTTVAPVRSGQPPRSCRSNTRRRGTGPPVSPPAWPTSRG